MNEAYESIFTRNQEAYLESWLLLLLVTLVSYRTLSSSLVLCMKSRIKNVMKKNMQFMMPNAKLAFSIAHSFLILAEMPVDPETPLVPTLRYVGPLLLKLEQLAPAMPRSS